MPFKKLISRRAKVNFIMFLLSYQHIKKEIQKISEVHPRARWEKFKLQESRYNIDWCASPFITHHKSIRSR